MDKAVGYAISRLMDARTVVTALNASVRNRVPPKGCIQHSDLWPQYASEARRELLAALRPRPAIPAWLNPISGWWPDDGRPPPTSWSQLMRRFQFLSLLPAVLGLAACNAAPSQKPAGMLGFGTPAVSAYAPDGDAPSLRAQLERCERVPQASSAGETQGLPAACDQLRRTVWNQPGNSVQPSPPR